MTKVKERLDNKKALESFKKYLGASRSIRRRMSVQIEDQLKKGKKLEQIFPELREVKGEKAREEVIKALSEVFDGITLDPNTGVKLTPKKKK